MARGGHRLSASRNNVFLPGLTNANRLEIAAPQDPANTLFSNEYFRFTGVRRGANTIPLELGQLQVGEALQRLHSIPSRLIGFPTHRG